MGAVVTQEVKERDSTEFAKQLYRLSLAQESERHYENLTASRRLSFSFSFERSYQQTKKCCDNVKWRHH